MTLEKSAGSILFNHTFSCLVPQRLQIVCGVFQQLQQKLLENQEKKYTLFFFFPKVSSTGEARIIKESYIIIIIRRMTCFCKEQIWQRRDPDGIQVIMVCSAVSTCLTFHKCWGKLQGHPDVSI